MQLRLSHFAWALLLFVACLAPTPASPSPSQGESPTTQVPPEVRLRKLHLVRPDLIPYPLAIETYC
jgi:hypothetical protein